MSILQSLSGGFALGGALLGVTTSRRFSPSEKYSFMPAMAGAAS